MIESYEESCSIKIEPRDKPWLSKNLAKLKNTIRQLFITVKEDGGWNRYIEYILRTEYNKDLKLS